MPDVITILFGAALKAADTIVAYFVKRSGPIQFRMGLPKYVTHGWWDIDAQKVMPTPPMFLNYELPFTITNTAKVPRDLTVRHVLFGECKSELEKPNERDKKQGVTRKRVWHGSSLHPMGETIVEAEDGKRIKVIRVPAEGMVAVVLKGTNSSTVYGGPEFDRWRWVTVEFDQAGGKEHLLEWDINARGDPRICEENIEPFVPLPLNYPQNQAGSHLSPEQESMIQMIHDQMRRT